MEESCCGKSRALNAPGHRRHELPKSVAAIHLAAAAFDIAITIGVVTKQRDVLIAPPTARKGLRDDIAIIEIVTRIEVAAKARIKPPSRIIAGIVVDEAMQRTIVTVAPARSITVTILAPAIIGRVRV
jgi:hypothetical protein